MMKRIYEKIGLLAVIVAIGCACSLLAADSNSLSIDLRDAPVVTGVVYVSPSSGSTTATPKVDGTAASGWTTSVPDWDTTTVLDGIHTLSITGESATPKVVVLNDGVMIHEGILEEDEVWSSNVVHIVRDWVRIPEGRRLVITNDVVVKFCKDAGIINDGTLSAISAHLTVLEDDSIGGDTNLDGNGSTPAKGYAITNNGTLTAIGCTLDYAADDSVFKSTSIAEGAFSRCDELTKVVIPADVLSVGANAFEGCGNLTEVIFRGADTIVHDTAFDGCDNLEKVYFPAGLPDTTYVFGDADPVIYVNGAPLPVSWGGYTVMDEYARGILERTGIGQIENEGEEGQVLTKTEDGTAWMDIPVDAELDAESTNAVQNKAVTAAINGLKDVDAALDGDIEALSSDFGTQTQALKEADAAQQSATNALGEALDDQKGTVNNLQSKADNAQLNIETLQVASDATQTTLAAHLTSIEMLQGDMGAAKAAIETLQAENAAQQAVIEKLVAELSALTSVLNGGKEWQVLTKTADGGYAWMDSDAMGHEILTLKLEKGWNLVAMPGRVVVSASEAAMIDQIDIYTYDKKQKVYVNSDGLEPLSSYWMRAPEPCTIHFSVADEKPEEEEE